MHHFASFWKKNRFFSWFYHTIFKVLITQILYPKCSRMQHFASFWTWKKIPSPTAFSLSRVGMYALAYYMIVPTKYHWNISLKKIAIEICCQKCQECSNTFCVTNFFPLNFKGLSNKKYFKNIYTRILDVVKSLNIVW
jgi:hypothetical protein